MNENEFNVTSSSENTVYPESFSTADKTLSGSYNQPVTSNESVLVKSGTVIDTYSPAAIQILSSGKTVTVENSELHCNSIRNAAILFGEDAYWEQRLDGTVTFSGNSILLDSTASNCITAAGIAGNNLTVNFSGAANGAGGIKFFSSQGNGPANEAFGIKADGNLTINGTFGGMVQSYFDFSKIASSRQGLVYGFSADGNMLVKNDISGTLAASAYTEYDSSYQSFAYGLTAEGTLTVQGVISGTVVALAESVAYGIHGGEGINVTISGTVYAGKSVKGQTVDGFLDKLADVKNNKSFLLTQSDNENFYSIYSQGRSNVTLASGAEIWGDVFLQKESNFTISSNVSVYGDVTLYGGDGDCSIEFVLENNTAAPVIDGKLYDYNWGYSSFVIDASKAVNGTYILADEFENAAGVEIRVENNSNSQTYSIRQNRKSYTFSNGMTVEIDNRNSQLVVNISGSSNVIVDNLAPVLSGVPMASVNDNNVAFSWNVASDNTGVAGYQFRYGTSSSLTGEGVTVKNNSYHLEDLDNGKYYYQVRAYDEAGNYSGWSNVQSFTVNYTPPVYLPYEVPQAEYMYGCTATVTGMILGYYDRFGYNGYKMSNLIQGEVELNARGLDGNAYDMDAFDTVLGSAIASEEYVNRFYDKDPAHEYGYTFKNSVPELNTAAWNCIADYLGTGQYWRGNGDLSTPYYYGTLEEIQNYNFTRTISNGVTSVNVPGKFSDVLYGIDLYVKQAGYKLDASKTMTVRTSNNGGDFDFEDYKAEIDAGRAVMLHIEGHTMLGYGYDASTNEIILDDTYEHDQRMQWGGSYYYSGSNRELQAVSLVVFDESIFAGISKLDAPVVTADKTQWTKDAVVLSIAFDKDSVRNEYSFDQNTWYQCGGSLSVDSNRTVYFRSKDDKGFYSFVAGYEVSNIDDSKPVIDVTGYDGEWSKELTVFASATDSGSGIDTIKYSFDNINWNTCTVSGVAVNSNGTIYFKAIDKVGNETVTSVEVNRIDQQAPVITVEGIPEDWCSGTVVIKALASDSASGIKSIFYSYDNKSYQVYDPAGVLIGENCQIYFKATDNAGNTQITVKNIDKIDNAAPELAVKANTEKLTSQVILTGTAADSGSGIEKIEYSFDNSVWQLGSTVTVYENGTVYFRATDNAGNETLESFEVSNISDTLIGFTILGNVDSWTGQAVVLSIDVDLCINGVKSAEYSFDNLNWSKGSSVSVSENGVVYFRVTDKLGNQLVKTETVTRIDSAKPVLEITGNADSWTQDSVVLDIAVVDDVSGIADVLYQIDGKEWLIVSGDTIELDSNGTVNVKAVDNAGNETIKTIVVDKIDNIAPTVAITGNADGWTRENVVLDIAVADDASGIADVLYQIDGKEWLIVSGKTIELDSNGTVNVKAVDKAGNETIKTIVVDKIDNIAPTVVITGNAEEWTKDNVILHVEVAEDASGIAEMLYQINGNKWITLTDQTVTVEDNGVVTFKVTDNVGNETIETIVVDKIDNIAPDAPEAIADITEVTNKMVTVSAKFTPDSVKYEFSYDGENWDLYTGGVEFITNGTVYFRAADIAGNVSATSSYTVSNIDTLAPELPGKLIAVSQDGVVTLDWQDVADEGIAGVFGYRVRYGADESLSGGEEFTELSEITLNGLSGGKYFYSICSQDKAGNISEWSEIRTFQVDEIKYLQSSENVLSWEVVPEAEKYVVEYSSDAFNGILSVETSGNQVDFFAQGAGDYQCMVKVEDSEAMSISRVHVEEKSAVPQKIVSEANGNLDLFFAQGRGVWEKGYSAQHTGNLVAVSSAGNPVVLEGKNKIADIFEGSSDANILVLSDDANGDALFVDDVFTALPENVTRQQSRIAQIDEIRAGAGDDVIDMTSSRFVYAGTEITVRGGSGNDVIWASGSNNRLFGDAGDDCIVGCEGVDLIVGGAGDDAMHSGGGNDIFAFGGNWGNDTVEISDGAEITLYFSSGNKANYNEETRIYQDGDNSVTIIGGSDSNIVLKFGNEDGLYNDLAAAGAFDELTSEKIFEDKDKSALA